MKSAAVFPLVIGWFSSVLVFSVAAGEIKSGPQAGQSVPGPFHPYVVLHAKDPAHAGKRWDFVEEYGANAVTLVFARSVSDSLGKLAQTLDAEIAKHNKTKKIQALVVVLSDENDDVEKKLRSMAKDRQLKNLSLAIVNPAGPRA